jgi:hypothetical protein
MIKVYDHLTAESPATVYKHEKSIFLNLVGQKFKKIYQ